MVRAAFVQGQISPQQTGGGIAPQAIWSGQTLSNVHINMCWPPASGPVPSSYNLYRSTSGGAYTQLATGIVPRTTGGASFVFHSDTTCAASTQYSYYYTAVTSSGESGPSPVDTITTLAGSATPSTAPTPPTDPATWIVLPPAAGSLASVPAGNTLWLCTTSGTTAGTSGSNPGGGTTQTGCGLQYALNNANLAGGDVFVLTAGTNYISGVQGGFLIPAFTGASGFTYFVSTQAKEYTASGTLPAYSYSTAQGAGTGFQYAGNTQTGAGNYVGPWNAAAMPTIQAEFSVNGGYGISIATLANKIRYIGINFAPFPQLGGATGTNGASVQNFYLAIMANASQPPCSNIYFDRCMFGNNSLNYNTNTFGWVEHCLNINGNYVLVHQCYFWGAANCLTTNNRAAGDAQAIYISGGGPMCIQNCYIDAESEGVEAGGAYVAQLYVPHDIVYRYNYNTKLMAWLVNTGTAPNIAQAIGESVKNHFELKVGNRVACYGNVHQNNWIGLSSDGQGARSFVIGARDELAANSNNSPSQCCPWVNVTDVDIYNNIIMNVGCALYYWSGDFSLSAYTARVRFQNNLIQCNVAGLTPSQGTGPGAELEGVRLSGALPDGIINQNTFIISNTNGWAANPSTLSSIRPVGAIYVFSPYCDRFTITNNIFDGQDAVFGFWGANNGSQGAGVAAFNGCFYNTPWGNNLTTQDTAAYPGTNFPAVPYASIGFTNFVNNTTQPNPPSDWSVTGAPYNADSTTGGPLGAIFPILNFPLLGGYLIGGSTTGLTASHAAVLDVMVLGAYAGWTNGSGQNISQMAAAAKAINPNFKMFNYTTTENQVTSQSATTIAAVPWWLYSMSSLSGVTIAGTSGQFTCSSSTLISGGYVVISGTFGGSGSISGYTNPTTYKISATNSSTTFTLQTLSGGALTTTTGTPTGLTYGATSSIVQQFSSNNVNITTDSIASPAHGGQNYPQWRATYDVGVLLTPFTSVDGIYVDSVDSIPRVSGDWEVIGTNQSDNTSSIQTLYRAGYVAYFAAVQTAAAVSQRLLTCNVADWYTNRNGLSAPGVLDYNQKVNGGVMEGIQGQESTSWAQLMANYSTIMTYFAAPAYGIFSLDLSGPTNYAGFRYFYCSCLLGNGYFFADNNGSYNDYLTFDEYSFNLGAPIAGPGNPNNTVYGGSGYTAWKQGVWRRDFQNGISLVNPRGNGAQTVTLETTYYHLTGTQDPTINNGAATTSVTLPDPGTAGTGGSGLVLSRTPT